MDNRTDTRAFLKAEAQARGLGAEEMPYADAYFFALALANPETVKEAMKMSKSALTLEKVLEEAGWIARWKAEGKAEGEARGEAEGQRQVLAMFESGKSIEEAKRILGLAAN